MARDLTIVKLTKQFYDFFGEEKRFVEIGGKQWEIYFAPNPIACNFLEKGKVYLVFSFCGYLDKTGESTEEVYIKVSELKDKTNEEILKIVVEKLQKLERSN